MKKLFTLLFGLSLFLSSYTFAQQDNNSMLWEVSGKGLKQPSYIQGTMHMMCASDFKIKDKTFDALAKSKRLVLEIDYTNPTEMTEMANMLKADKKLSETLTAAQLAELKEILKSYNSTLEEVDSYTPQGLYSLISKKSIPCDMSEVKMFEIELLTKAAQSGKTFGGLEKVADQMAALGGSYNIKETLRQLKAGDEYAILAKQMTQAFNAEELVTLDKLLKDKRFMNKHQEDLMLNKRNINWVSKAMPDMMEKESVMFAVGSGHLWGKQGMIELLKAQGYTVKPIK